MRFDDKTPVMQLGKLGSLDGLGKLPITHSISPFMGLGGVALGQALDPEVMSAFRTSMFLLGMISLMGGVAAGVHGYYRNKSIGWALGWGALGVLAPVPVNAYALGQGFMKRRGR